MEPGGAAGLRRWLEGDEARAADPTLVEGLWHALDKSHELLTRSSVHGSRVCYIDEGGRRRRVVEFDRHATLLAALRWTLTGLHSAWLRLPDRSWLRIEAQATTDAPWGLSDRLWWGPRLDTITQPLTVFEALDYDHIDRIPTLADPSTLPPGAGSVVLNLVSALAEDQQVPSVAYDGPYPTEQLFATLLECFRPERRADPLAAFVAGNLRWQPAPHERLFADDDVYVQRRGRIDKVVWRGRSYERPDWPGGARHAARRLLDDGEGTVRCSLWALGRVLEDHLVLGEDGQWRTSLPQPTATRLARPVATVVARGVATIVAATSAPPLAAAIRSQALVMEWAHLPGELVVIEAERVGVSLAFRDRVTELVVQARTPEERAAVGLIALTEIASALGDTLRRRAQAAVAALPEVDRNTLLQAPPSVAAPGDARAITDAVAALLDDATT